MDSDSQSHKASKQLFIVHNNEEVIHLLFISLSSKQPKTISSFEMKLRVIKLL